MGINWFQKPEDTIHYSPETKATTKDMTLQLLNLAVLFAMEIEELVNLSYPAGKHEEVLRVALSNVLALIVFDFGIKEGIDTCFVVQQDWDAAFQRKQGYIGRVLLPEDMLQRITYVYYQEDLFIRRAEGFAEGELNGYNINSAFLIPVANEDGEVEVCQELLVLMKAGTPMPRLLFNPPLRAGEIVHEDNCMAVAMLELVRTMEG